MTSGGAVFLSLGDGTGTTTLAEGGDGALDRRENFHGGIRLDEVVLHRAAALDLAGGVLQRFGAKLREVGVVVAGTTLT
jgi:hypothetical protein